MVLRKFVQQGLFDQIYFLGVEVNHDGVGRIGDEVGSELGVRGESR